MTNKENVVKGITNEIIDIDLSITAIRNILMKHYENLNTITQKTAEEQEEIITSAYSGFELFSEQNIEELNRLEKIILAVDNLLGINRTRNIVDDYIEETINTSGQINTLLQDIQLKLKEINEITYH